MFYDGDERTLIWAGVLFYCVAFAFALGSLLWGRSYSKLPLVCMVMAGFILQTAGLYLRGMETSSCPLSNLFEFIQFIAWSAILLYLFIGPVFRMSLLGLFSSGLAAGLGIISLLVKSWDERPIVPLFTDPWIETHAAMAVFSYGVLGTLALTSFMYLIQSYGLQHKRFKGVFVFLPSIVQLDQMSRRLLLTGVAVLTTSIIVGSVYWLNQTSQVNSVKLIFTFGVWGASLAVLKMRISNNLLTKKFAWACIVLFAIALLSLWPVETSRADNLSRTAHEQREAAP